MTVGEGLLVTLACFCLVDGICYYSGMVGTVLCNDPDFYKTMAICIPATGIMEYVMRPRPRSVPFEGERGANC